MERSDVACRPTPTEAGSHLVRPTRRPQTILIIAPYPIFPTHNGGSIRTFQIARGLGKLDCQVTILGIRPFGLRNHFDQPSHKNLEILSVKYPFRLPYLLTGKPFPYHFIASFHPGFRFYLRKYLAGFDVYQFEHPNFADLLDHIAPGRPVIYNSQNVEYDYTASECVFAWAKAITRRRIYKLEKKLVHRCSRVLACSEKDKQRFIELYAASGERIEVIPNGINKIPLTNRNADVRDPSSFPLSRFRKRALFAGGDSAHNRIAAKFILTQLAPRLRGECAFVIKGSCGKKFQRHSAENVFIDPEGGSIEPYARLCTVALNPVTQGGGTSLKVLDYLCHGLPVVSTEFGMRGYDDLKCFVTICDLKDFAGKLAIEQRFQPEATTILERYLWRNGALKIKSLYSSLVYERAV